MERCARELLGSSCEEAMESRGKPRPTEREGAALVAKLAGKLLINNTLYVYFDTILIAIITGDCIVNPSMATNIRLF